MFWRQDTDLKGTEDDSHVTKPDVITVSLCIEGYVGLQQLYIRILKLCLNVCLHDESASTGANLCLYSSLLSAIYIV